MVYYKHPRYGASLDIKINRIPSGWFTYYNPRTLRGVRIPRQQIAERAKAATFDWQGFILESILELEFN